MYILLVLQTKIYKENVQCVLQYFSYISFIFA